jgi:hypothetical protein
MKRFTSPKAQCSEDANCKRPVEFTRTREPIDNTNSIGPVCRYHAFWILRDDPAQMAELLLDLAK